MITFSITETDRAALELVVTRFMNLSESTIRKDLLSKFRSRELLDRLTGSRLLKRLNTEGDLAPTCLGVEALGNAEYEKTARQAFEMILHVLQNLYDSRPARTKFQLHDVLAHASQMYGDVHPIIINRGIYFAQELDIFDGYGPETAQQVGKRVFDVNWFTISEKIVEVDPSTAWNSHVGKLQAVLQSHARGAPPSDVPGAPSSKDGIPTDGVTGIPPRAQFDADFPEYIRGCHGSGSPLALLHIDLDKFKQVNDRLLHSTGDKVLRETGSALISICKRKGAPYRVGGDEFVVLLPNHTLLEASATAERIRVALQEAAARVCSEGVTASIGVASFPETSSDTQSLLDQADAAMYAAKRAGGNRVNLPSPSPNESGPDTTTLRAPMGHLWRNLEPPT